MPSLKSLALEYTTGSLYSKNKSRSGIKVPVGLKLNIYKTGTEMGAPLHNMTYEDCIDFVS